MKLRDEIIKYNTRQGQAPELSDFFSTHLGKLIEIGAFSHKLDSIKDSIVADLEEYRNTYKLSNIVLGMSGGIDSALTASLFKEAGWNVTGLTLPIHQNPEETQRGIAACEALGITHKQVDLSQAYDNMVSQIQEDASADDKASRVRRGNIRARLRMITLYNEAAKQNGIVGSTDNFSELSAGFWTLHGDVGDVAPIQSLSKSWEVPALADMMGVPQETVYATPTDGLGVDAGDEAQFGFTYLHFDIVLLGLLNKIFNTEGADEDDVAIIESVKSKIKATGYKRINPVNLRHPLRGNDLYDALQKLDDNLLGD
jgi:nicotinamide-nucleotide amidase